LIKRIRYYIFLRDVALLAVTAFGGPQAHLAMMLDVMVKKRNYLSEEELIELNALCQILPGPTSTQTITAIGYRIGGAGLAYLTLLVWMMPAVTIMTMAGVLFSYFNEFGIPLTFTKFIQPMAVGVVSFAAYRISLKVVKTSTGVIIMVVSGIASYFVRSPWVFPIILIIAGMITGFIYKARQPLEEKNGMKIDWRNFILWAGVFVFVAVLGGITKFLPVLLFENFYRNGSLIFGGGQVLIPMLYTEFVDFKHYLSGEEFLSGFSIVQALPGPVFSFSSYIGALSMREAGIFGEIIGGVLAALGIFLPGTLLIFFIIKFWDNLKKYRLVRASLEGINAASSGMVVAAAILLFQPLPDSIATYVITFGTFCLLVFTKIPTPFIILTGLLAGLLF